MKKFTYPNFCLEYLYELSYNSMRHPLFNSIYTRSPLFNGKMIELEADVLLVPPIDVTASPFSIKDTL